jgi:4-amino-4-deoxy-L-arabinose transferase-like glycosyltransferase
VSEKSQAEARAQSRPGGIPAPAIGWLIALAGWTAFLATYGLEGGARFEPIDAWVAQTAREMLDAGDWLVPRFAGEVRMQKSPGAYWAVMLAAVFRGGRVDEISARIPSAIAAVVLVVTVFVLTRAIAGDRAAVFAGFALSATALVLWWSHRAAADLGLTTLCAVSLCAFWIGSERYGSGWRRVLLWLLAYFTAGVGMLYKMPMPLVVVGLPAILYVVICRRWRLLVSGWHLVGLLLFLLPWLPWVVAVTWQQSVALAKWKVEFWDRFTGDLPNVANQRDWIYLFTYLVPTVLYTLPFTLSLPGAMVRAARRTPGVDVNGSRFMLIWFFSLLAFFTASVGKEWRYFLPALPPLYVLLGIELSRVFDPDQAAATGLVRLSTLAVWTVLPTAFFAGGLIALYKWYERVGRLELEDLYTWSDIWPRYAVAAAILSGGFSLAAWWYRRGRKHWSFAGMVATMWIMWLWVWPYLMPVMAAQRPMVDFAQQLRQMVPPEWRPAMRHVGTHNSQIIWYSDLRYPRLLDQLKLLAEQGGRRSIEYEERRYGEELVNKLESSEPILLVATLSDFLRFLTRAPEALAQQGRSMPRHYLWLQSRYGGPQRQFVVFSNRPPPFEPPPLRLPEKLRARLKIAGPSPATASCATAPTMPATGQGN